MNCSSVYFPKREAFKLKSVRAFPNVSMMNFAVGTWLVSLDPFLPGLETESSRSDLMARRRFSVLVH